MYTRWRLYILAVFILVIGLCLFIVRLFRKGGMLKTGFQAFLFVLGTVLIVETLIVFSLSNFNLGVILPAFFGVPMVLIAFLLPYMDHGFLRVLKWIAAGCYAAAAFIFLVCGFLMIRSCRQSASRSADAVIVLGAAVHGDKVTWVLENRLNTAKDFLDAHPDCICVVSGGMGSEESVTEASAMKKYLVDRGMDPDRVIMEEQATNTPENFLYSKALIDDKLGNGAEIAFVTTDFHIYRAGRVAKSLGIDAFGLPAPDVWYLRLNNFLRECVGICVYALRGQI